MNDRIIMRTLTILGNVVPPNTQLCIQTNTKGYRILRPWRGHIVLVLEKAGIVRLENGLR